MFPRSGEHLLQQAKQHFQEEQYDVANDLFAQASEYIELNDQTLGMYCYSLYEVGDYEKAKEIGEQWLALGPAMYFEAMELYLTIAMQLRDYGQVEKMIEALLEEGIIPKEQLEKFQRLRHLNGEIAKKQEQSNVDKEAMVEDQFYEWSVDIQLQHLYELQQSNIRPIVPFLKEIIERKESHILVKSIAILLLVEQQVEINFTVEKFGEKGSFNSAHLAVPTEMPQYVQIEHLLTEALQQQPTTLEMANGMLAKHALALYPFAWGTYSAEEVANGYLLLIDQLFGNIVVEEDEIVRFLQYIESLAELH